MKVTFEDAALYKRPWTVDYKVDLVVDSELLEYVCSENEKDLSHLVGKASDDKKYAVKLPRELLSQYAGSYELRPPDDPKLLVVYEVTLSGDELVGGLSGKDLQPLTPLSDTTFSISGGRLEFVKDEQGVVTHLVAHVVEGDLKAVRRR